VHATLECVEKAVTRKAFGRALKAPGALVVSAATAQQLKQAAHPTEVPPPVGTRPGENNAPERVHEEQAERHSEPLMSDN